MTDKTISGFAVQISGFIPVPKGDSRAAAAVHSMMADIEDGTRPASDLLPMLTELAVSQKFVNKRAPVVMEPNPQPSTASRRTSKEADDTAE